MQNEPAGVDLDRQFEALGSSARRRILLELFESSGERALDIDEISLSNGHSELALYHSHIPRLEAAGFVEMDGEQGVVYQGENYSAIEPLLSALATNEERLPL